MLLFQATCQQPACYPDRDPGVDSAWWVPRADAYLRARQPEGIET